MRRAAPLLTALAFGAAALVLGGSIAAGVAPPAAMPYAEAGLTPEEAAAHLLSRFTFGARPGEAARVAETGLERWFEAALTAPAADAALDARLAALPAAGMTDAAIARTYPRAGRVLAEAVAAGVVGRPGAAGTDSAVLREVYRSPAFLTFMEERGYRPERELGVQLVAQKVLRVVEAEAQMREVMTDFWFNHFNVAAQDGAARTHLLAYERDALRPNALGQFRTLLGAAARHPAMLLYLDNAQSVAPDSVRTTVDARVARYERMGGLRGTVARRRIAQGRARSARETDAVMAAIPDTLRAAVEGARRKRGVNENYARELLELHTLGVDGGYTQADVENIARAFTGWTVWPENARAAAALERRFAQAERAGAVREGLFLFRPDAHDATEKTILGARFPAGGSLDEGERVLDMVSAHPATARHVARKLAARFVADEPPSDLVDALARVYLQTGGDVAAVVRAIPYHAAFWTEAARAGKVKSPLELAASAVRAPGARLVPLGGGGRAAMDAGAMPEGRRGGSGANTLVDWIERMGQPLYRYVAPTGFPDRADAWVNAGTLAARMNFALALASGRVRGVELDAGALLGGREPESPDAALAAFAARVLPAHRAPDAAAARLVAVPTGDTPGAPGPLAHALGVLLGSPAFQRR